MLKRTASKKKKVPVKFVIPAVIAAAVIIFTSKIFIVKTIQVNTNGSCVGYNDLITVADFLEKNIFFIDKKNTEEKVKNKFLCVKSLMVDQQFPDKIRMELSERIPKAVVAQINPTLGLEEKIGSSSSTLFLNEFVQATPSGEFIADESGFIFGKFNGEKGLPKLYFVEENIKLGKRHAESIQNAFMVKERLKELNIYDDKIIIIDDYFFVKAQPEIFFSADSLDRQLASLQLILQKAKMNSGDLSSEGIQSKVIKSIDLRFSKPVVVYSK